MQYDPRNEPTVWGDAIGPEFPWKSLKILCKIGEGSFGTVYEVKDMASPINERFAIKHISVPKNKEEIRYCIEQGFFSTAGTETYYDNVKERVYKEIEIMNELSGHSHIVNYLGSGYRRKTDMAGYDIFIKMELLLSLQSHLNGLGADEMEVEIAKLGLDICDALKALHLRKIIHRDIKPANILYKESIGYKLADFGVARSLDTTGEMSVAGALNFLAPEILKHMPGVDHRSDIYSLGLVMYRMLNGNRMPFLPSDPKVTIDYDMQKDAMDRRIQEGASVPPIKGVNQDLMTIILKACSYRAEDRFQDATQMSEALNGLQKKKDDAPREPALASLAVSQSYMLTKAEGNRNPSLVELNDKIFYKIVVKNNGNVKVSDIALQHTRYPEIANMKSFGIAPNAESEITYQSTVEQSDIDNGALVCRITVSGIDPHGSKVYSSTEDMIKTTAASPEPPAPTPLPPSPPRPAPIPTPIPPPAPMITPAPVLEPAPIPSPKPKTDLRVVLILVTACLAIFGIVAIFTALDNIEEPPQPTTSPNVETTPVLLTDMLEYRDAEFGWWDHNNQFNTKGSEITEEELGQHNYLIGFRYTNNGTDSFTVNKVEIYQNGETFIATGDEPRTIDSGETDFFTISVHGTGEYSLVVNGEKIGSTTLAITSSTN